MTAKLRRQRPYVDRLNIPSSKLTKFNLGPAYVSLRVLIIWISDDSAVHSSENSRTSIRTARKQLIIVDIMCAVADDGRDLSGRDCTVD